jgi:transposase-like protein
MVWLVRTANRFQGGQQTARVVREVCPACASPQFKKNGHIHTGKHNHRCKDCGRQFVEYANIRLIDEDRRALVARLLLENISLPGMCRAVGVSIRWLIDVMGTCFEATPEHIHGQLPNRPDEVIMRRLEAEAGELCSFVRQKANKY